ncbi:MAG: hypothetical protein A2147_04485 [Chloroflexi bacterium RBG_16_57_8]|nr:MAG: hypothetical protein A2147_04485 [Chloroflexi bacterium RBG_16_57_8]
MQIDADYSVKTDAGARATITFYEGSSIDLEGSTEIKLDALGATTRTDRNPATGTKWPLVGNDIGYDYLVRVWLMGTRFKQGVLNVATKATTSINYTVQGNVVDAPSVSDKSPNASHYTFP